MPLDTKTIVSILDEMGTLLELQGANPFKSRAFHNASRALEGVSDDMGDLVDSGGIREIPGIGESIAKIIADLVTKGRSNDYDDLKKAFPPGVPEMLRISGLGPKRVKVLFEQMKITSLDELQDAARANKLANLAGFGEKTEQNILKGIEALRVRSDKHLYPAAFIPANAILHHLKKHKGVVRAEIAGSLRRKKEVIGDVDLVVSAKDSQRPAIMDAFVSHPEVQRVVGKGETKSSVVLTAGINCDLRIVDDSEFPFALNYFTGSKEHNVEMRTRAKQFGWSLNEYGFSEIGADEKRGKAKKIVRCKEEVDLYRALKLSYVPPELRENTGEFVAAEADVLPDLIEERDIRGTFHCHTTYSDGVNSLEQMAKAAKELGWEYLGIADHSKVAAYAGGLSEENVKAQFKEIDELNKRLKGFRVIKGTECDILPNGDLDWSENILASFEYVVASVHSSFKKNEKEMTKRIVKALKNKHVTMLGHPTGRLLLSREGYPVNMVQIINCAADYGKAIEINSHPTRLDLDWRLVKYAKEKGVMIAINPDAHNIEGLRDVFYGVGIARKGWLEKKNVLNSRPLKDMLTLLHIS
ncbi:MAG: DNA polymerase/3'-5' exonuclease PolX [Bacteroidetes bacterium]|nr:DNA polymerase/3'-5' exonuclease PolX [Bacteroidota bacterium]MCW5896153.1 DNA polymerase/3'-5' exonuclease PolX [Bacteroidota bacterium]